MSKKTIIGDDTVESGSIAVPLLEHEMRSTSKVFSRNDEIKVVFEGNEAKTNGNTIFYPSLDKTSSVSKRDVMIGHGYVDHESGHIRYSDMEFMNEKLQQMQNAENYLGSALFNAVEDIRIEKNILQDYRGTEKNITSTAEAVNEHFLEQAKEDASLLTDGKMTSAIALTWAGRKGLGMKPDSFDKCLDMVDPAIKKAAEMWAECVKDCENTKDAFRLARMIENDIRDESYKNDDYDPSSKGGTGNPEEGDGGDGDEDGGAPGVNGHTPAGESPEDVFDPNLARAMSIDHKSGMINKDTYRVWSDQYDKVHHRTDAHNKYSSENSRCNRGHNIMYKKCSQEEYQDSLAKLTGKINTMARKLERALMAKRRVDWDFGREVGRLDPKRLSQAYGGSFNVFKDKQDAPALDTCVSLLIDLSGSMSGRPARMAQDCAIALYEVLGKVGIPFEVTGFNNSCDFPSESELGYDAHANMYQAIDDGYDAYRKKDWTGVFHRFEPLNIYEFKRYDEQLFEGRLGMSCIRKCVAGNNSDADAIYDTFRRIKGRPEQKKVMIVMSDGQPACATNDENSCCNALRASIKMVEDNGIDVFGIGIMDDAVSYYYPKYSVVNSLEDLPTTTMDFMAKSLLGQRFQADNSAYLMRA